VRTGIAVLSGLLVLAHFTLHVGFGLGSAAPDLLTLALLVFAREVGVGTAAATGLAVGLLEDALAVLSFGANAVALALLAGLGSATRELFVGDSSLFGVSYLFMGKLARDLLHWVLVGAELREPFVRTVVLDGGIAAAYLAAVGVSLFFVLGLRWDASGVGR
jgi:rod shape-determining protein MreD